MFFFTKESKVNAHTVDYEHKIPCMTVYVLSLWIKGNKPILATLRN